MHLRCHLPLCEHLPEGLNWIKFGGKVPDVHESKSHQQSEQDPQRQNLVISTWYVLAFMDVLTACSIES